MMVLYRLLDADFFLSAEQIKIKPECQIGIQVFI